MTDKLNPKSNSGAHNQGEGDKEAAARYEKSTRDFIGSGRVDEAVKDARHQKPDEGKEAEEEGRKRAKEEDPAIHRDFKHSTK